MLNVAGDEPDTKKLRKSHSTVTHLTQHASVQGALKRSLYPFAALALWAPPYLRSKRKQLREKAPGRMPLLCSSASPIPGTNQRRCYPLLRSTLSATSS